MFTGKRAVHGPLASMHLCQLLHGDHVERCRFTALYAAHMLINSSNPVGYNRLTRRRGDPAVAAFRGGHFLTADDDANVIALRAASLPKKSVDAAWPTAA